MLFSEQLKYSTEGRRERGHTWPRCWAGRQDTGPQGGQLVQPRRFGPAPGAELPPSPTTAIWPVAWQAHAHHQLTDVNVGTWGEILTDFVDDRCGTRNAETMADEALSVILCSFQTFTLWGSLPPELRYFIMLFVDFDTLETCILTNRETRWSFISIASNCCTNVKDLWTLSWLLPPKLCFSFENSQAI